MSAAHQCDDAKPCPVPPHPDLLARLGTQPIQQQNPNSVPAPALGTQSRLSSTLSAPTGTIPGLNDGKIFPDSHFGAAPSKSRVLKAALERAPLRGAIRAVIVLMDFEDKPMASGAAQRFNDLFFSTGKIGTKSVTEYFADVSSGKISFSGQVLGPFRAPLKNSEYAHGAHGMGFEFPNVRTLAADALAAAKSQVDFNPYDNDGNGYVDAFIVVHAGSGGEVTGNKDDIWSLKWVLPNVTPVNNVNVFAFLTIPDDAAIGVSCHEIGHLVFGWPDFYDYDGSSDGIGSWCLMAGGTWGGSPQGTTPCHPSAWCKANQGWVDVVTETTNRSITLADVKSSRQVHRLWTRGDINSKEYFLIENRNQAGFDQSLPGSGLLVWHVDDNKFDNTQEEGTADRHLWVGLMQADGLNQLATRFSERGDAGDPFPGSSMNKSFTSTSNPNSLSYSRQDTFVSVTEISGPGQNMTMNLTVQPKTVPTGPFTPVFRQGDPGNGIGGYDLRSKSDLIFAYDYTSSGKLDHLVLYRPGTGTCWILENKNGTFTPKYREGDPGNGIGGFDLKSTSDRALAFDYNSSGKLDHLVFYRPQRGAIFILKNTGGRFTAVYAQADGGSGIGGFDLRSAADRIFALDYRSSGKNDHLCLYRPGTGTMWILRNDAGNFTPVFRQGDPGQGIGGYDLKSPADRAFAFDWNSSGKQDHIALYRPRTGTFWVVRRADPNSNVFTAVLAEGDPGRGIGGYDLKSASDRAFAFDWDGSGNMNHVALYRPGTGTFWCLANERNGRFRAVFAEGDPGKGVGGYDVKSPDDVAFAFDWASSGHADHVALYRPGTGTFWVLKRG